MKIQIFAIILLTALFLGACADGNLVGEAKGGKGGGSGSECKDRIDNDGDGAIDGADAGCNDRKSKDETNCGDGVCEGGETIGSCSVDCESRDQQFCAPVVTKLRQDIGEVQNIFTVDDIPSLAGEEISTSQGTTSYTQTVMLSQNSLQPMAVNYVEDENDVLGDFLVIDDGEPFFEYHLNFDTGLRSARSGEGLQGITLNILGQTHTISYVNASTESLVLGFDSGLELFDSNFLDDSLDAGGEYAGTVSFNNENIEDASVALNAYLTRDYLIIDEIKYRLKADANIGSTVYAGSGVSVASLLDEPEGALGFDIVFQGLNTTSIAPVEISVRNNYSYEFTATNARGNTYNAPFLANVNGTLKWGDENGELLFTESSSNTDYFVSVGDYFVLNKVSPLFPNPNDPSAVFQYVNIDTDERILTFVDMSTGNTREVTYDASGFVSNFIAEGETFKMWVGPNNDLAVDLNGNGFVQASDAAAFTALGGGFLNFGNPSPLDPALMGLKIIQPATGDYFFWEVFTQPESLGLSFVEYQGPREGDDVWNFFDLLNDDNNDEYDFGRMDYGGLITYHHPANSIAELTIEVPASQALAIIDICVG